MTRRSRGFSLVSAIFLMVVLAVLGGSIVTLSSVQHATSALRVQSLKAQYASRAGLEWAIARIGAGAACATANSNFTLGQLSVAVGWTCVSHDINGARNYFVVTSTATGGIYGGTDYVSRQLESKVLGP